MAAVSTEMDETSIHLSAQSYSSRALIFPEPSPDVLYVGNRLRTTDNEGTACILPRFGWAFGSYYTA
jgi:hypothetical protein